MKTDQTLEALKLSCLIFFEVFFPNTLKLMSEQLISQEKFLNEFASLVLACAMSMISNM